MQMTPEVQEEMGEAAILAKGQSAAITSGAWTLIIPDATDYIPDDLLGYAEWLADKEGWKREYVDYRVLNAREFINDKFLAFSGKELENIAGAGPFSVGHNVTYESAEEVVVSNEYIFEGVDLVDLLVSGKAEAVYPKVNKSGSIARVVAGAHKAESYVFRVGDSRENQKAISVSGRLLRGLQKAGFSVLLNTDFEPDERGYGQPFLGLVHKDDPSIGGALAPLRDTGITECPDGRWLGADAGQVCWISHARAEALIAEDHGFFDPTMVRHDWEDLTIDDRIKVRRLSSAALGIGALRWRGVPDEEIKKILNYAAYDAWCALYNEALGRAGDLLERVDQFSKNEDLSTSSVHRVRQFSRSTNDIVNKVKSLTKVMHEVGGDNGDGLGMGPLPELVDYIKELEKVCGLS